MDGGGNLPEELIYNVLTRLPAKSVGRFRCVCKHWQTLLSDPQFLKTQFNFNNLQTKLIFRHNPSFISIDFCEDGNNKGYPIAIDETLSFKPSKSCRTILGSCNGLLLLIDSESSQLSISNPITHESRQLPPVPVRSGVHPNYSIFGFGYCSYDDDYTVVVVLDCCCISRVYMLKRNCWKRVENSPFVLDSDCGVFANGALHWLGFRKLDHSKVIYAFDLVSERFNQVELPEGLKEEDKFALDVVGGRLCLAVKRRNRRTDLWLMKEYGERMSWIKYLSYTLNLQKYSTFKPLFFWGGNEFIVGLDGRGLMLCSLKRKKSTMISVIGERFSDHFYRYVWTFSASLYSPNCSKAVE